MKKFFTKSNTRFIVLITFLVITCFAGFFLDLSQERIEAFLKPYPFSLCGGIFVLLYVFGTFIICTVSVFEISDCFSSEELQLMIKTEKIKMTSFFICIKMLFINYKLLIFID